MNEVGDGTYVCRWPSFPSDPAMRRSSPPDGDSPLSESSFFVFRHKPTNFRFAQPSCILFPVMSPIFSLCFSFRTWSRSRAPNRAAAALQCPHSTFPHQPQMAALNAPLLIWQPIRPYATPTLALLVFIMNVCGPCSVRVWIAALFCCWTPTPL